MKETIDIENPKGVLRLKGDWNDSVLYMDNIPIQFTWIREIGSTWRYHIARSIRESDLIKDNKFRQFVKFGYLTSNSITQQFDYIINLFFSGKYELTLDYLSQDLGLLTNMTKSDDYYSFDTYGGLDDIIETQSAYDEYTVNEYMTIIQKGVEPIMVVYTSNDSKNKFILDGHHKYIAYSRLKRNQEH